MAPAACEFSGSPESDIAALAPEAARISGIPMVMDIDREEAAKLLSTNGGKAPKLTLTRGGKK